MSDGRDFDVSKDGSQVRMHRRQSERVAVELGVTMTSESNFYVGFAGNISEGGLFIATHQMVPVGREIDLRFQLPGVDEPVDVKAGVRWQRTAVDYDDGILPGFGVEFLDLDDQTRRRIEDFIADREPIFHPE